MYQKILLLISVIVLSVNLSAAPKTYNLKPKKIAENTWIFEGVLEHFNRQNGGNIVNTAFIVTEEGVVVIDTGPSLRYGKEMRKAIESVTKKPIKAVFNSHHHPDHFLGNYAFKGARIMALPKTIELMALEGDAFATNLYEMLGDWMRSTEVHLPTEPVVGDRFSLGSHSFRLIAYTGHSGADLVLLDEKTGVLFANGMVFYQRALTTPHTPGLKIWADEIAELSSIKHSLLVPGHGPVVTDDRAFTQMTDYLGWLDQMLAESAEKGLSMTEVMKLPIPERFKNIAVSRDELIRTVFHLYPEYEDNVL